MPRQPIEKYYSEKELHQMVSRINAFASEYSPWKFTHARKEHRDLFGDVIKPGEYYFKHGSGPAFDDVIKLSAPSMEKLCFALFESAIDSLASVGMLVTEAKRFRRGEGRDEEVAERRSQAPNGSGARLCARESCRARSEEGDERGTKGRR